MTALALREDQDYWDEKQLAVLRQTGIGDQVSPAELAAFLHLCQRTGLDPFARQIYLIGRWDSKAGREVFRPQTGIDGYRIVAQRTVERTKQSFGYEDSLWCGPDGQWTDVWLSPDPPAAAKVTVLRDGKRFPAIARWTEYVPLNRDGNPTGLWVKRHAGQLEKCAESLALRKAFPNDMAGVYTAEEMEQADNPHQPIRGTAEHVSEEQPPELPSKADDPWLAGALEMARELTLDACRALWQKSSEKVRSGELPKAEAQQLQAVLRQRMEELKDAEPSPEAETEAEAGAEEVIEGEIVPDSLDPQDPWAAKVEELSSEDEAVEALVEASILLGNGDINEARFHQIEAAILVPFPDANKAAAVAS